MENTEGGSHVDMTLYFFMLLWGMNLPLKSSKKYTVFIFLFWSTMRTLMFNICSVLVCFIFSPLIFTGNFVLNIWHSFFSCFCLSAWFFFNFSGLPEFLFYGCQLVQPSSTDLEPSRPVRIGNKWIFFFKLLGWNGFVLDALEVNYITRLTLLRNKKVNENKLQEWIFDIE